MRLFGFRKARKPKENEEDESNIEFTENSKSSPKNCSVKSCPRIGSWKEDGMHWCGFHKDPKNRYRRKDG